VPTIYIIAGCNGAGKTTASFTVLPELLQVKEFVNADEIARGLSPFQPEMVSIEAGRIMLHRIDELIRLNLDFAFETTLATRSFAGLCDTAKSKGYQICLIFLWLDSIDLAIERVKQRVSEGGHDIPEDTIRRRYKSGLFNFFSLYKNRVDMWLFLDNSGTDPKLIAEGTKELTLHDQEKWQKIIHEANDPQ
jgi:predicted ABC-type ATPase